jgi:lipopolysaccharide biosynthesis glycosyltransferase
MKNLIYVSVFYNKKYIELLHLLLQSLKNFGKIDDSIDILIMTHHTFRQEIEGICNSLNIPCLMALLNNTTIPESKWARFKIFELDMDITKYSKILYLDTDVIVQKDIRVLFENDLANKLYARREGDTSAEFFGGLIFKERGMVKKVPGFCSGVLLFKPCTEIRQLFSQTLNHIHEYQRSGKEFGTCVDQPVLNFYTITKNLHEIELLSDIVTNRPDINTTRETICHFAGNTCSYEIKFNRMKQFYSNIQSRKSNTSLSMSN